MNTTDIRRLFAELSDNDRAKLLTHVKMRTYFQSKLVDILVYYASGPAGDEDLNRAIGRLHRDKNVLRVLSGLYGDQIKLAKLT